MSIDAVVFLKFAAIFAFVVWLYRRSSAGAAKKPDDGVE
jgi:hypothetical protein